MRQTSQMFTIFSTLRSPHRLQWHVVQGWLPFWYSEPLFWGVPVHPPTDLWVNTEWVACLWCFGGEKTAKKQRDGASQLETLSGAGESFILVCSNVQMSWKAATRASSSNRLCRNDCRRHQLTARQADRFYNCKSNSIACSKLDYAVSWQKHFRCVSFASYNRVILPLHVNVLDDVCSVI